MILHALSVDDSSSDFRMKVGPPLTDPEPPADWDRTPSIVDAPSSAVTILNIVADTWEEGWDGFTPERT